MTKKKATRDRSPKVMASKDFEELSLRLRVCIEHLQRAVNLTKTTSIEVEGINALDELIGRVHKGVLRINEAVDKAVMSGVIDPAPPAAVPNEVMEEVAKDLAQPTQSRGRGKKRPTG